MLGDILRLTEPSRKSRVCFCSSLVGNFQVCTLSLSLFRARTLSHSLCFERSRLLATTRSCHTLHMRRWRWWRSGDRHAFQFAYVSQLSVPRRLCTPSFEGGSRFAVCLFCRTSGTNDGYWMAARRETFTQAKIRKVPKFRWRVISSFLILIQKRNWNRIWQKQRTPWKMYICEFTLVSS